MPVKRVLVSCAALQALIPAMLASSAGAAPPPVSTIPVLNGPAAIAISPTRAEAYVADAGGVSVIDLQTNTVTSSTGTGVGVQQTAIGSFRRGTKVYVGDFGLNTMVAFNAATTAVTPDIPVGFGVTTIAHARQGFALLGLSQRAGTRGRIKVVDTATDAVVAAVTLKGAGVQCAARAPGTGNVWAGSTQNGRIWVFNSRRNKIVRRLMARRAGPVQGIAFTPNGRRAWVFGLGGISVISRRT
jgi:DNA-binding beta-propeller fold protein YncE